MLKIAWEAINRVEVWQLAGLLFVLSVIMQRIINKFPLVCQSVYVVPVPWGILWVNVLAYLWGLLTYPQMIQLAALFLCTYPFMWWANYKFTQAIVKIFKEHRISKQTTGIRIWAREWNELVNEDLPVDNVNSTGGCFAPHLQATRRVSGRYRRRYSRWPE
jgi:hypothetical protein